MAPVIEKLRKDGYAIDIIDRDKNSELAKKYGVSALPTIIILNGDIETKRWVGIVSESELRSVLKKFPDYEVW